MARMLHILGWNLCPVLWSQIAMLLHSYVIDQLKGRYYLLCRTPLVVQFRNTTDFAFNAAAVDNTASRLWNAFRELCSSPVVFQQTEPSNSATLTKSVCASTEPSNFKRLFSNFNLTIETPTKNCCLIWN